MPQNQNSKSKFTTEKIDYGFDKNLENKTSEINIIKQKINIGNKNNKSYLNFDFDDRFSISSLQKLDISNNEIKDDTSKIFNKNNKISHSNTIINKKENNFNILNILLSQSLNDYPLDFISERIPNKIIFDKIFVSFLFSKPYLDNVKIENKKIRKNSCINFTKKTLDYKFIKILKNQILQTKNKIVQIKIFLLCIVIQNSNISEKLIEEIILTKFKNFNLKEMTEIILFLFKTFLIENNLNNCENRLQINLESIIDISPIINNLIGEFNTKLLENSIEEIIKYYNNIFLKFLNSYMTNSSDNHSGKISQIIKIFEITFLFYFYNLSLNIKSKEICKKDEIIKGVEAFLENSKQSYDKNAYFNSYMIRIKENCVFICKKENIIEDSNNNLFSLANLKENKNKIKEIISAHINKESKTILNFKNKKVLESLIKNSRIAKEQKIN